MRALGVGIPAALAILILVLARPAASARKRAAAQSSAPAVTELERLFRDPPNDCRIMMRWWWFGPAVAKPELERELRLMKDGGIGGFEVQPVYPLALDDEAAGLKTLPYLSDDFLEALRFASAKARELGLRMDLTLGSGWPYGGPQVPIGQAAGKLRFVRARAAESSGRIPVPAVGNGEKLIAAFLARTDGTSVMAGSLREIEEIADGAVRIPAGAEGSNEVLFFISSRTGMMVKRPAFGAEGFVLNHYDRSAVESYLKNVGDRLLTAFGADPPYAIFCDSLEVFDSDWTDDFLEEFRRRRGYDLKPHLPALVMDMGPQTAAIRHDRGKTLTELCGERFLAPVRDWAGRNQTRFRLQCYGIPPVALSSNAYADLPEGEGSQWKIVCASRWAASASRLYGRPVTSSETWTWLHSPAFRATPLDVKAEAHLHFLQGINQLIGHGWPYTAEGVAYPGWQFYAAGVFNEKNPWWIVMPDVARYLQRISFLLRQGEPVSDIALYLPNGDAWASFSPGRINLIEALRDRVGPRAVAAALEAGFNLDFFDDEVLKQIGRVEDGALRLGPNRYRIVILPNVERIPLETLTKLEEFSRGGGVLVATRRLPAAAPGFAATEADHDRIREAAARLFEGPTAPAHFVEDEEAQLASRLRSLLQPDVLLTPPAPSIGFVHRRAGGSELYFLANTSNARQIVKAEFRQTGLRAKWWDPATGQAAPAEISPGPGGTTTLSLDLEPYAARLLVFTGRTLPQTPATSPASDLPPIDISMGWQISFGEDGKRIPVEKPRSWTDGEESRFFSGVAAYEKSVILPESMLRDASSVRLDFGQGQPLEEVPGNSPGMRAWLDGPVREAAVVVVNDRRAGSVWCPPYSLDVTGFLRAGENRIKIMVANTAINHMAGRSLADYRLLRQRYGTRFEPQDTDKIQPLPSGLLGPIRLIPGR